MTAERVCSVGDCGRRVEAFGLCNAHNKRLKRLGIVGADVPVRAPYERGTPEERFWSKVDKDEASGCWLWTAYISPDGYGRFGIAAGVSALAHHYAYEQVVGPIPLGLHLDHVKARGCLHRHCVNPAHLEAVTQAENNRRAMGKTDTGCVNGHAYKTGSFRLDRNGNPVCRECRRGAQARYVERKKVAA